MPKLPSAQDYSLSTPSPRRGVAQIRPIDLKLSFCFKQMGEYIAYEQGKLDTAKVNEARNKLKQN